MKKQWHKTFLKIVDIISEHSTCARAQVGAVLVKDTRIISIGYNGVPSGIKPHCNEIFDSEHLNNLSADHPERQKHTTWQQANEIHAEINAIGYAARNGIATEGTTMYIPMTPCQDCCKAMIAAGIKQIVYPKGNEYKEQEGLKLLKKAGVKLVAFEDK